MSSLSTLHASKLMQVNKYPNILTRCRFIAGLMLTDVAFAEGSD
jgi:hypothetical protein